MRFRTRKHFAVLIRLAVEPGRPLTRDLLIDLLWSDAADHLARHSLAQALTVLKEKLGHQQVLVRKGTVALAPGCVDVDVAHLDACDAEIRGPFLDGLEIRSGARAFEDWKTGWQARLIPKIRDCLVRRMDGGRRIGDFATVERQAQVLLELDPVSEDAVRGIMEARAWVGDRSNALQAFARYETRLAEELGAKPSTELVRIANLLREGRRPLRHGMPVGVAAEPGDARDEPISHEKRFESETLIGREREFSVLYDGWLAARGRVPRLMVVTGDPGVGKTTLCNTFASTCQMEGAVVARAQAYDAERELPFAVLAEIVKQLTIQRAIGAADPDALSELSRISSEICAVFPGVPKPIEWSAEVTPLRLADAFLKVITAAAEDNPVVLVVDDVHAVDNASAAILHLVARKLPDLRLVIILAGRTSELRASAAPAALVADTSIAGLRAVEIEPLSTEASAELVSRLGSTLSEASAASILQASNGNPLAIELLIRECLTQGPGSLLRDLERLNTMPAATLGIPRAIRTVFERQSQRLSPPTRAAMDLAAVLGRRLTDLALYEAVGLKAGEAGEALSRLLEEGVLRAVHGDLEFRNELIRAQAYYGVAGPPRQHLHRRVAELLAGRTPEDGESLKLEIAWHYLRGGAPGKALPYALEGAEEALDVGAPREAEKILSALLALSGERPESNRIRLLLSRALVDLSKAQSAIAILDLLRNSQTVSQAERAEAAILNASAEYLLGRRSYPEAAKAALDASELSSNPHLRARAHFEFARSGLEFGDLSRVRLVQAGLGSLTTEPNSPMSPYSHYVAAYCHYHMFEIQEAVSELQNQVNLLKNTNKWGQLSLAYNGLANCWHVLCETEKAIQCLQIAFDLAKKLGDDSRSSIITNNIGGILCVSGEFEKALHYTLLSVDYGLKALDHPTLSSNLMNVAETCVLLGRKEMADSYRQKARAWLNPGRSWRLRMMSLVQEADIELMCGNVTATLDAIVSAEQIAKGRENAMGVDSSFEKFRVFRIAHTDGPDAAFQHAAVIIALRRSMPLPLLDVLSAKAWLERRVYGEINPVTKAEIAAILGRNVGGRVTLLTTEGFLE